MENVLLLVNVVFNVIIFVFFRDIGVSGLFDVDYEFKKFYFDVKFKFCIF